MNNESINKRYFDWMCDLIYDKKYMGRTSYYKLLSYLHNKTFTYKIAMDSNRAMDGVNLRYRFAGNDDYLIEGDCSVLEMMVALSYKCEEQIMSDDDMGNRTGTWFWGMIFNLGLDYMDDCNFDKVQADKIVYNFLNRKYLPNGEGGLFTVKNRGDLRKIEIWYQMCWYLDTII